VSTLASGVAPRRVHRGGAATDKIARIHCGIGGTIDTASAPGQRPSGTRCGGPARGRRAGTVALRQRRLDRQTYSRLYRVGHYRKATVAKVIYKITYPNGKIYVGMDLTDTLTYFGTVDNRLVEKDFTPEQRRDFVIHKEILWESETASDADVRRVESEYIRKLRSNDPAVRYNRWPPPPPSDRPTDTNVGQRSL
jgi:hypothetical protein